MSEVGGKGGATNDHSIRDQIILLPMMGTVEIGNSGFRFVRIDLIDNDRELKLKEARAISIMRDIEYYCCPLKVSEQRDIHPQCCCNGIADDFSEGKPLS